MAKKTRKTPWGLLKSYLSRVFIDGLSGMALGLFSTLIVGTMLKQLGAYIPGQIGTMLSNVGAVAQVATGAGIGCGVAVKLGAKVIVATADGSYGVKGFVTDAIKENNVEFDYLYTCGPLPMLKALYDATECPAEFSFEERMGCGFGACMGCSCKTKYGNKRICKDGPVLKREEIIW